MIAVDTNVLVYAHREDSPWFDRASLLIRQLAEGRGAWAIPWPCIHEVLGVVTHPRIYNPPTPLDQALEQIDIWLESPTLVLLGESSDHWNYLRAQIRKGQVKGPRVHDARIAAICLGHGIRELWSADRDFGRFPELPIRNPLID